MPPYLMQLLTNKSHNKKNKNHGKIHGKMNRRRQKIGCHNSIVTTAEGLAIPLTSAIGCMVFLAPQPIKFRTNKGEDKHLPGRLITLGLRMSNNRVPLRHQH